MKSSENIIWNSIQHLKEKLQSDKMQLQNIRSELHRSKSPFVKNKEHSNKENDSYISNSTYHRNSIGGYKPQEL